MPPLRNSLQWLFRGSLASYDAENAIHLGERKGRSSGRFGEYWQKQKELCWPKRLTDGQNGELLLIDSRYFHRASCLLSSGYPPASWFSPISYKFVPDMLKPQEIIRRVPTLMFLLVSVRCQAKGADQREKGHFQMAILPEIGACDAKNDLGSGTSQKASHSRQAYTTPQLFCVGHALDVILARAECKSRQVAERVRRLIDESSGSLSFSPAGECQRFQVSLSLVSRQFKKIYRVTIRSYARNVRMKTAEKLLKESKGLNIDETARIFGYSFTSAFSRCFQQTFGKRPKRFQMQNGNSVEWPATEQSDMESGSQPQA